ncbi:restriction endonuclease subunit S [Campylobacter jejuni]|uniref:restriction endonuclease subunit S n=1 Tax=Campylobacter jejuni TaxID=197 RepID=UPI0008751F0E|nr:restriction endonuclease subunit S [Campylobacter jejuni]EAK3642460.1 restriction endonuclease subunit S [Campylobacter coli]EAI0306876.1 restriction endonuclease subunit S [Campylobacter jejuni]EAI0912328.1 restriction endonuclease subunit S [Campylobacter jejuni]EAI2091224.1 restriction endonuclease subunit S [Campylobacter jejuni]EAI3775602.1 restriction endonuclease subunit S [Campylobacter jejuni]
MKNFKNSGIEWLGEIPKHWEVSKFKYFYRSSMGETILAQDLKDDGIPIYSATEDDKFFGRIKNAINILNINDFVIPARGNSIGAVKIVKEKSTCTQTTIFSKQFKEMNSYYVYYFLLGYRKFLFEFTQTAIPQITISQVNDNPILYPPLKEQEQIANFLDEKCEQIANFIEKKEKLINLLKEQKQVLINETITKGLDKNVNFKDSGIEWLGEIPQHWEVKRLANFGTFLKGNGISRQDLVEYGEPAILYGDIYTKYQIKTHFLYSKISKKTLLSTTPICNGDILFSGSGETKEDIGKSIVYLGDDNAFAGGDVIIFRQKENNALFLSYVLNTKYANFCKSINSKGEIIVHIYASNLKDIKIPLPPLKEQEQIANFLDEKCEKIDLLIEKTEKQIKLIKEYKTTLINQAVCGRINL